MPGYLWTPTYSTPAAPTGLTATPVAQTASLDLAVNASSNPYHETYVWEAQSPDGPNWIEIGRSVGPAFSWLLAPFNETVGIRVRDNIGAPDLSDPIETTARIALPQWWLTNVDGDGDFIRQLDWVQVGYRTAIPLDQVTIQPLSIDSDAPSLPLIFTGQFQGERTSLSITLLEDDLSLMRLLQRAARQPAGKIAIKDPSGPVYLVQFGGQQLTDQGAGVKQLDVDAVRVA